MWVPSIKLHKGAVLLKVATESIRWHPGSCHGANRIRLSCESVYMHTCGFTVKYNPTVAGATTKVVLRTLGSAYIYQPINRSSGKRLFCKMFAAQATVLSHVLLQPTKGFLLPGLFSRANSVLCEGHTDANTLTYPKHPLLLHQTSARPPSPRPWIFSEVLIFSSCLVAPSLTAFVQHIYKVLTGTSRATSKKPPWEGLQLLPSGSNMFLKESSQQPTESFM